MSVVLGHALLVGAALHTPHAHRHAYHSHVKHEQVLLVDDISSMGSLSTMTGEQALDANGEPCKPDMKVYNGIGVIYNIHTGQVLVAPTNLPAYQEGIRIGDLLLNDIDPNSDGIATMKVLRYNIQLRFDVKPTKICFKETA